MRTLKILLAIIFLMVSFQISAAKKHVPDGTTLSGLWKENYTQTYTKKDFIKTFCVVNPKKLVGNCSSRALSRLQNHGKFYYWNIPEKVKHLSTKKVLSTTQVTHTLPHGLPGIVVKNLDGKTSIAQLFKTSLYKDAKFAQDFCDVQMYGKYGQYKKYGQCIYGWNNLLPEGKWNIPTKTIVFVDKGTHFIVKIETS
jgi:hypothetical protein